MSKEESAQKMAALPQDDAKWLTAHIDPLATLYTFTSCMTLADLNGDGDHKLIIADLGTGQYDMKLKVYKGTSLVSENTLLDLPTAVTTFFMDSVEPRVPAIAVASGACVYVYKNLKPYYKYTLPSLDVNETERDIWDHVRSGQLDDVNLLTQAIENLRSTVHVSALTGRSQRFLMIPDSEKEAFVSLYKNEPLRKTTIVTCLSTMKKSSHDSSSIDCLIMGTESRSVYVLDSEAFTILAETAIPDVPCFFNASGLFDVEYRILVCARNGCVYTTKRGTRVINRPTFELNSHVVGMTRVAKTVVVACMDKTLRGYSLKGKKLWSLKVRMTY